MFIEVELSCCSNSGLLLVCLRALTLLTGPCSFRVAAPFVWNNLPRHLRNDDISREQFGRDLKTFLFARAYSPEAPLRTSV